MTALVDAAPSVGQTVWIRTPASQALVLGEVLEVDHPRFGENRPVQYLVRWGLLPGATVWTTQVEVAK